MEKNTIFNNTFGLGHGRLGWLNACVGTNGFPDSLTYAEGYLNTPEILTDYIINNNKRGEVDLLVYPIVYSARHGIELSLKTILVDMAKLRGIDISIFEITKIHSIKKLWDITNDIAIKTDIRLLYMSTKINSYILDFIAIDDTAQTFRYPESNVGTTHLEQTPIINLVRFIVFFKKLKKGLKEIINITSDLKGEYQTGTFTDKLSRRDLIKLAKILGGRDSWESTLTSDKKKKLKLKFNLDSNKQLIKAIDKIQANRYLSSLIEVEFPLKHLDKNILILFKRVWYKIHLKNALKKNNIFRDPLSDLGTTLSDISTDDFLDYIHLKQHINTTYLPLFSEEQLADLTTLIIMGRQYNQYHAEDYEKELEQNLKDAYQDKKEAFRYIFDNAAALLYIRRALKLLGCKRLSIESHFNY
ncbi:DUF3775 domain-containing protein [Pectobacterium odoriferum]|uniref:DUF3775 domain-containing protein n=1 Tax=Pectobacterium TaxID=122277 RepID=UPI001968BDC4|nr:DUF3775 domain-containing protein [Pectobacterium versatile]MBN3059744.1 DUF3775 domain-containing protein [Pectobacterium versatile]MCA5931407.1 DUF3775 domain-containing protein [Pectobacterium versatile]MCA5948654.1 DUF3775 domain-containing protein [Pectobacterium versatile]MCA5952925.1 DUF3775 domain-containing protein [Pectobacterium versatile]UCP87870.1 DUF3775 domain-containing protein [Pectobacterium versatile]